MPVGRDSAFAAYLFTQLFAAQMQTPRAYFRNRVLAAQFLYRGVPGRKGLKYFILLEKWCKGMVRRQGAGVEVAVLRELAKACERAGELEAACFEKQRPRPKAMVCGSYILWALNAR